MKECCKKHEHGCCKDKKKTRHSCCKDSKGSARQEIITLENNEANLGA